MKSFLAVCLILVCFVDKSYGTFGEFLNNLPSEVANAFTNAWTSITEAIQKPVRIKRLGPGGSLKSTPSSSLGTTLLSTTTDTSLSTTTGESVFRISETSKPFVRSTTYVGNKLTLPLLPSPRFKTLDQWNEMQKAHFAKRKKVANPAPVVIMIDPPERSTRDRGKTKPITIYDDDSFATMMVLQ